jgi:hypothetical protein
MQKDREAVGRLRWVVWSTQGRQGCERHVGWLLLRQGHEVRDDEQVVLPVPPSGAISLPRQASSALPSDGSVSKQHTP